MQLEISQLFLVEKLEVEGVHVEQAVTRAMTCADSWKQKFTGKNGVDWQI